MKTSLSVAFVLILSALPQVSAAEPGIVTIPNANYYYSIRPTKTAEQGYHKLFGYSVIDRSGPELYTAPLTNINYLTFTGPDTFDTMLIKRAVLSGQKIMEIQLFCNYRPTSSIVQISPGVQWSIQTYDLNRCQVQAIALF
jgi:hypothetical protein